ncbi:signal peptidase I [Candidatus Peregrinibacteria bacterium]|nr:signal peptidase I [Candidatus Peregrinibacteria bacterium]
MQETPKEQPNEVSDIFKKQEPSEQKEQTQKPLNEEKPVAPEKGGKFLTFVLDLALNLLIVFGLVYIIQTFIASPFKVFGPSMCDTLNNLNNECQQGYGEYIIVNKLIYKDFFGWSLSQPDRGDIIVFHPPHTQEQFYIKRIIGIPGDTIKLIDGNVFLFNEDYPTGYELPEEYLNENNKGKTNPSTNRETSFSVPDDQYFVLGDNRNESTDSRSCFRDAFQGGCRGEEAYFLPRANIEGKAWVVLWPLNHIRVLPQADY